MSLFGSSMPTLIADGTEITLPLTVKDGRAEDFEKIADVYENLSGELIEDVRGFRLVARYKWDYIESTPLNNLVAIHTEPKDLKLRFSGYPKGFRVRITEFKKGLRDGLNDDDALEIAFEGTELLNRYPNLDLMFTAWQNVQSPGLAII